MLHVHCIIRKGDAPPIRGAFVRVPHMGFHGCRGFTRDFERRRYSQDVAVMPESRREGAKGSFRGDRPLIGIL